MFCAGNDQHNIFSNRDLAIPVNDQQFQDVEILQRPLANLPQLLLGHALVMLKSDTIDVTSL